MRKSRNHMAVPQLAEQLGIDRSNVLRRLERVGIETITMPVMTASGPQRTKCVPWSYAEALIRLYAEADKCRKRRLDTRNYERSFLMSVEVQGLYQGKDRNGALIDVWMTDDGYVRIKSGCELNAMEFNDIVEVVHANYVVTKDFPLRFRCPNGQLG